MYIFKRVAIVIVVLETCLMLGKCAGISEEDFLEHGEVCESKGDTCLSSAKNKDARMIDTNKDTVKVFTFASEITDGYQRFNRSAGIYGVQV